MGRSGYDECVGITRLTMRVMGIWPGSQPTAKWYLRIHFLIPLFFMLFFVNYPQTNKLLRVKDDLNMTLEILTTADIIIGIACLKHFGIWYNRKHLRYILIEMQEDWNKTSKVQQTIMWHNVKIGRFILISCAALTYGTVIVYTIQMLLILNAYATEESYYRNNSITKPMFFTSQFFFDAQTSPVFEVVWICQFIAAMISVGAFTSFDGFFIFSILHLCSQLTNLQSDMKYLTSRNAKRSFAQLIGSFTNRHIHLQKFTYNIEQNFNKVFLVQMICYSISLCLQGYQIVVSLNSEMSNETVATFVFIVIYTAANILSLFTYCYVAQKLRDQSMYFFFAIYEINWYDLEPKESKMLLNVMHATISPFTLTAGKFVELSFEYFMKVLKTSAGYLSVLLAVKSKL